jgi:nitrite transporter NirC
MPTDAIEKIARLSHEKTGFCQKHLPAYLISASLAGAYVGLGLILAIMAGAPLFALHAPLTKPLMGAVFAIAYTLVVFAGAELFTGNNMFMTIGWLSRRVTLSDVSAVWLWSYVGNILGSVVLAVLMVQTDWLQQAPYDALFAKLLTVKTSASWGALFARGILCNVMVCLAAWMTQRTQNDVAKILLIFWCLFLFVTCGFEHSVANMTLFSLALMLPGVPITWEAILHNMVPVTLGNIVGGALCLGLPYWYIAHSKAAASQVEAKMKVESLTMAANA